MQSNDPFFQAFVYLAAAVVMVPLAQRLKLGSVLGYLVAGILIGPFVLKLVGTEGQDVMHFAEFGVVMMLFLVGLELQPALLLRMRAPLFGMGGLQVLLTALVVGGSLLAFGLTWRTALAVGLILSLSSTAIVLQSLQEKGLLGSEAGQRSFAVLLFQDLAVIPMLALMPLLALGPAIPVADAHGARPWIETLPGWGRALATLGAVTLVVLVGQWLVRPVFRALAASRVREILTAAALLLVVGIAILMTQVGLSPALGTFLAGVVLANSEYRHELESDIEPFKGLLLGLFFIAVGASIDFHLIAAEPALIVGAVVGLVAIKAAVLFGLARAFRLGPAPATLFAVALAQGGEFAFVLSSFAAQNGVLDTAQAARLVATVALSMAFTPLLMLLEERVLRPRMHVATPERPADDITVQHPVLIAGFGHFGSVVGRFLAAHGVKATVLDVGAENVEQLRRLGFEVHYGDASRFDLLRIAGAERARLLVVATGDWDATLAIVRTARRHFPELPIYARALGRFHAYELLEAGAHHVYRDTLDTSLRLGVEALTSMGVRAHQAHRTAQAFRRADEQSVHELLLLRHDKAAYTATARERIRALEERLFAEMGRPQPLDEEAWDAESLREEFAPASRATPQA